MDGGLDRWEESLRSADFVPICGRAGCALRTAIDGTRSAALRAGIEAVPVSEAVRTLRE
jgi:hypothetical protein